MADKKTEMAGAREIARYLNRTRDKDRRLTAKDILAMPDQQIDSILTEMVGGDRYSSGGLASKNYVNPVKIVDNRKKKK
jgi:hypothetical protein